MGLLFSKKKITLLLFSASLLFLFCSCKSEKFDAQNTVLGHKISIGMEKDNVDKLLGEPTASPSGYYYKYIDDLTIQYEYGKIKSISIYGPNWETEKGIKTWNDLDEIYDTYGENELVDPSDYISEDLVEKYMSSDLMLSYYLDENGNTCDITDSYRHVAFFVNKETKKIKSISINDGYK